MTFEFLECKSCQERVLKAGTVAGFSRGDLETLLYPARVFVANIPVMRGDGSTSIFPAIRSQYNTVLGPAKGGIRFHPSVDVKEVVELSFLMAIKTALFGLPYGGGKGGVVVDPKLLLEEELEELSRGYVRAFFDVLGSEKDIPAPDVGTSGKVMNWMTDEFEKLSGKKDSATFTGKTLENGGSLGRETSTSMGGYFLIKKLFEGKNMKDISVAIQGFGNVGGHLASMLAGDGFKIVAVSDSTSGLYEEGGLPVKDLLEFKNNGGRFLEWEGAGHKIGTGEVLEVEADILVPSALGGVITQENSPRIKAKTIIEMANGPVDVSAEENLLENGVSIIPDILANAGGVIVSYFEWEQNRKNESWSEEEINKKLEDIMDETFGEVVLLSKNKIISLRDACYVAAIERILKKI